MEMWQQQQKNYGAAKGQIGKLQTQCQNNNCDNL